MRAERIQVALDVGRTGIWIWDPQTGDFSGDSGMAALWGLDRSTSISMGSLSAVIHPDDSGRVREEVRQAARLESPDPFVTEFRVRRANDGAERWIKLMGRRFQPDGPDGPVELIGMGRDITSRKDRDVHTHLLVREVTHRSKNLLAIIQAMARQTVKDSLSAAEFEQRFSARLRGLAASHDLLAARDWHGAPIGELVRWQLGAAIDRAGDRISIDGPTLFLKSEAAQNIGLALNELATNALRYGALATETGRVSIAWGVDTDSADERHFHISWRETGGPPVGAPQRSGFGHKVLERLAARALDGIVSLTFAASGLQWSLRISASFVVDESLVPPPVS